MNSRIDNFRVEIQEESLEIEINKITEIEKQGINIEAIFIEQILLINLNFGEVVAQADTIEGFSNLTPQLRNRQIATDNIVLGILNLESNQFLI